MNQSTSDKIIELGLLLKSGHISEEEYKSSIQELSTFVSSLPATQNVLRFFVGISGLVIFLHACLWGYLWHFIADQRVHFSAIEDLQQQAEADIFVVNFPYSAEQIQQLRQRISGLQHQDLSSMYGTKTINKGNFQQGCDLPPCKSHELPLHQVELTRSFEIMRSEVTQELYQQLRNHNPSQHQNCPDCPVEMVSWLDAIHFANRLSEKETLSLCYQIDGEKVLWTDMDCKGWRLPTEAEWELAAKLMMKDSFLTSENPQQESHSVCSFVQNDDDLCDMFGNVWEWTWDGFSKEAYAKLENTQNPVWPHENALRSYRGGGWESLPSHQFRFKRGGNSLDKPLPTLGFRLVKNLP